MLHQEIDKEVKDISFQIDSVLKFQKTCEILIDYFNMYFVPVHLNDCKKLEDIKYSTCLCL